MKNRLLAGVVVILTIASLSSCRPWWHHDHDGAAGCTALYLYHMLALKHNPFDNPDNNYDSDVPIEPATPVWARSARTGSDGSVLYAASAGSDGVYAAGYIVGDLPYGFGNASMAAGGFAGGINAVLIKYDSSGNAEWAATAVSGPGDSCFYSVAAASDGIYAAGSIQGNGIYSFGNGISVAGAYENGTNMVLVKYTEYGTPLWASSVTKGPDASIGYSIALGPGSIYVSGYLNGNSAYGFGGSATVIPASPDTNAAIIKYDRNGTALWARSVVTGPNSSCYYAVATGADGIYAAGYIDGSKTYDFGNGIQIAGSNPYGNNIILVRYDSCGNPSWARSVLCGNDDSAFQSVTVGDDGIFAAGSILGAGPYDFGNGVSVNGACERFNALIVKYDTGGTARWGKSEAAAPDDSSFLSVAVNSECVYAAGYISGNRQFDFGNSKKISGTYESGGNAVLVEYCTCEGGTLGARTVVSGSQESIFNAVTANGIGVYAAGYITGTTPYDFGNSAVVSGPHVSGSNTVLVRY